MIKTHLLNNVNKVIPVEHRAKYIQEYILISQEDLRIFSKAFNKESDPAFRKLIALKIITIAEKFFEKQLIMVLKDRFKLDPDDLNGAIKWRLPR